MLFIAAACGEPLKSWPTELGSRDFRRFFRSPSIPLASQGEEFMKKSKELRSRAEMFTAEGQGHEFFNRPPWLEKTTPRMDDFLVSIGYLQAKPTGEKP